jgi:hypothetical protein
VELTPNEAAAFAEVANAVQAALLVAQQLERDSRTILLALDRVATLLHELRPAPFRR